MTTAERLREITDWYSRPCLNNTGREVQFVVHHLNELRKVAFRVVEASYVSSAKEWGDSLDALRRKLEELNG